MTPFDNRAHASTLLDLARLLRVSLNRLPATPENHKAQRASAVLELALEELLGSYR